MTKLNGWNMGSAALLLCAATAITASAQSFSTLVFFGLTDGANPNGGLIQGIDGNFYGTTEGGGTNDGGTVFKITSAGALTTLYDFCARGGNSCTDGELPYAALVLATDGNFYGTTEGGGANCAPPGCGTIFRITSGGTLTTLYSFCAQTNCTDGSEPTAGLVQASDGNFYGTTGTGGANGGGTVFKITSAGNLTTLYSFCAQMNCTDGDYPYAGLIQGTDGSFYGTTTFGGAYCIGVFGGCGTVFEITAGGKFTTLYSFCAQPQCADGAKPFAGLVQASERNFYGATYSGGTSNAGTVFKITSAGNLTTLYSFCAKANCADGNGPDATLILAAAGNFYGATAAGGSSGSCGQNGCGTIFEIDSGGGLFTEHSFSNSDGANPGGALLQATNGDFYGTTFDGGALTCEAPEGCGTVFSLSVRLGPFVKFLPAAGRAGTQVGILGTALSGATRVAFNGTPAQFSLKLPTLILAHVPPGATTGYVTVTTPTGVLKSNVAFQVIP